MPLDADRRQSLLERKRPKRALPLHTKRQHRRLPLLDPRDDDQRYKPIYAVWEVTLACDLACRHCGSRAAKPRPDELSTEECLDLIRQMAAMGVREVTMIGGEAYLRPDFLDLVRAIRAEGMVCGMTTGGRGLTPELCVDAAEAGLTSVSVSLDGMEQTHDRLRGVKGSFRSVMSAFENLRAAGIKLNCNTQINALSLPELPEILETIIAAGARAWQLQLTVAMGRAADEPDVLLQPFEIIECFETLGRLKDRCDEAGVVLWPGNNIGYFGPLERKLRGNVARGEMASCAAGRWVLGIESDGAIKGCPSLPTKDWVGGTVRERSLREIWEQTEPLRYTRDRTLDDLWGFCRDCYFADVCMGGCTWTSTTLLGKPGNNPLCQHRALELRKRGKRERFVKVEDAPNLPFDHGRFELVLEDWPDEG